MMPSNGDTADAKEAIARAQIITRRDHLIWCKRRALEYVDDGDLQQGFASMMSDLGKHDETSAHIGMKLGAALLVGGYLQTTRDMRKFIEGFN